MGLRSFFEPEKKIPVVKQPSQQFSETKQETDNYLNFVNNQSPQDQLDIMLGNKFVDDMDGMMFIENNDAPFNPFDTSGGYRKAKPEPILPSFLTGLAMYSQRPGMPSNIQPQPLDNANTNQDSTIENDLKNGVNSKLSKENLESGDVRAQEPVNPSAPVSTPVPKKKTVRDIKLELSRPEKPSKTTYIDDNYIKDKREQAEKISKANAIMSVLTALMDSTQINKEGYTPVTGAAANQVAGIPGFLQNLQRREDIGNAQYGNALERYNNAVAGVQNQEKMAEYNREVADERFTQQLNQQQQQYDDALAREKMRQRTDVIERMIQSGAALADVNKQLKDAGLPEMSEETYRGTQSVNKASTTTTNPLAKAGLALIMADMHKDGSAAAGGVMISQDAVFLEKMKGNQAAIDAYAESKFQDRLIKIQQKAQQAASSNNIEELKTAHDDMRQLLIMTGEKGETVDKALKEIFPMLYQQQQSKPAQQANNPIQQQQQPSTQVDTSKSPRFYLDKDSGQMKNVDEATGKKIDEIRNRVNKANESLRLINEALSNPNLPEENRKSLEISLKTVQENARKANDELKALMK